MLESLLSPAEVVDVVAECDALRKRPPEERLARDRVAQGTRHLVDLHTRSKLMASIVERAPLIDAVTTVLGATFKLMQAEFRSPQPGFGEQRLHADDAPKLDSGPASVATAIVPLVDFAETNGATRLVPGSHDRPDLQRVAGSLESHSDEITVSCPAGTAIVFNGHLLHSGTKNRSEADRPALQLVWRSLR